MHSIINYSRHAVHGLPRGHSDKRIHLLMQYNWFPRIRLQMLYNWFSRIIYLIIESLYSLTNISPFPAPLIPGNHLLLCFYRQTILDSMYKWDRALCVSCVSFISLSIIPWKSVKMDCCNDKISSFYGLILCVYIYIYTYIYISQFLYLLHPFISRWILNFHIFVITCNVTMNMGMHIAFQLYVLVFLWKIPKVGLSDYMAVVFLIFWEISMLFSIMAAPIHSYSTRFPFYPYP